jgi:hypothetical protein
MRQPSLNEALNDLVVPDIPTTHIISQHEQLRCSQPIS